MWSSCWIPSGNRQTTSPGGFENRRGFSIVLKKTAQATLEPGLLSWKEWNQALLRLLTTRYRKDRARPTTAITAATMKAI